MTTGSLEVVRIVLRFFLVFFSLSAASGIAGVRVIVIVHDCGIVLLCFGPLFVCSSFSMIIPCLTNDYFHFSI